MLKRRFEEKLAEEVKVNPKSFWRYATQKCSSRCTIPDILHDSKSVADPELKVEVFNQSFSCFFVQPQYCISYTSLYDVSHNMEPILITDTLVLKELTSLKCWPRRHSPTYPTQMLYSLVSTSFPAVQIIIKSF